jgi:hypothetical protein
MAVAGFEKFILELCDDRALAPLVGEVMRELEQLDLQADGDVNADRLLAALEWVARQPKPLVERLEKMRDLTHLKGKVRISMRAWSGW